MGEIDGRGMAIGIVAGVVLGLVIMLVTGNPLWLGLSAAFGAIIGINIKPGSGND